MKCSNCGSEVNAGAKFCPECGAGIAEATELLEGKICPECGTLLEKDALFCNNCGHRVTNKETKAENSNPYTNSSSSSADKTLFSGESGMPFLGQSVHQSHKDVLANIKIDKGRLLPIALVIVILICAIGYIHHQKNSVNIDMPVDSERSSISENQSIETENNQYGDLTFVDEEEPKVSSYTAYKSNASWLDARQYARQKGGYLVCINDEEEFYRVCQIAEEANIKVFWVGATREFYEEWDEVQWLDGEYITYTKWLPGEPTYYDEYGYDEEYLMVFKVDGEWYFNDAVNDVSEHYPDKMGYIVEFEE